MRVPMTRRQLLGAGAATAGGTFVAGAAFLDRSEESAEGDLLPVAPSRTPKAPLTARTGHSTTWAGAELAVWGGWNGDKARPRYSADGALYDPAERSWRLMRRAPLSPRGDHLAVWSGAELLIWGGSAPGRLRDGAAYDPRKNAWRALPEAPSELSATEPLVHGGHVIFAPARYRVPLGEATTLLLVFDQRDNRWHSVAGRGAHVLDMVADGVGVALLTFDPSRRVLAARRLGRGLARLERPTTLPLGSGVDSAGLVRNGTALLGVFGEGDRCRIVDVGDGTRWREVSRFSSRVFRSKAEVHGDESPSRVWAESGRIWSASSRGVAVYDPRTARLRSAPRVVAFAGSCPPGTTPVVVGRQMLMWGGLGCDGSAGTDDTAGTIVDLRGA